MKRLFSSLVLVTSLATPALARQLPAASAAPMPSMGTPAAPAMQSGQVIPTQAPQAPPPALGQRGGRGQAAPSAPTAASGVTVPVMTEFHGTLPNPAVNVKLELSITDTYAGTPAKKTVTLLIANGSSGLIRTSNRLANGDPVNLNVDCQATVLSAVLPGGQRGPEIIRASLTFLYTPAQAAQAEGRVPRPADLTESVNVLLQDGKVTVVSQSADPATDRKVTVDVTATIIR